MSPVGIALIVGFIVILIVCIMIDKKGNEKFKNQMEKQYPVKEAFERAYVTEKGELLYRLESGTVLGYKKWNISDIARIATYRGQFSFLDRDGNTMRGEYLTPSKKTFLKEMGYASFNVGVDKVKDYAAFVKKHGPHIEHSVGGKVVQD
ncbi:MAG: hypothetical protein J1E83_06290 [Lachnospiraceae bacterium]|nr:hypothetical protein [Lachnospiraceae bacterium]